MKIFMTIMTDYAGFYGIYDNPGERFFLMHHDFHLLPRASDQLGAPRPTPPSATKVKFTKKNQSEFATQGT